jgi:hypothetical protein
MISALWLIPAVLLGYSVAALMAMAGRCSEQERLATRMRHLTILHGAALDDARHWRARYESLSERMAREREAAAK